MTDHLNHQQKSPGNWQKPLPPGQPYPEGYLLCKCGRPEFWRVIVVERSPYRPDRLFPATINEHVNPGDLTELVFAWAEVEPDSPVTEDKADDSHSKHDRFSFAVDRIAVNGCSLDSPAIVPEKTAR